MSEPEVLVEVIDGVGSILLNRPRAINALSTGMMQTIGDTLSSWRSDPSVERVELRGAGSGVSAPALMFGALREVVLEGGDFMRFFDLGTRWTTT